MSQFWTLPTLRRSAGLRKCVNLIGEKNAQGYNGHFPDLRATLDHFEVSSAMVANMFSRGEISFVCLNRTRAGEAPLMRRQSQYECCVIPQFPSTLSVGSPFLYGPYNMSLSSFGSEGVIFFPPHACPRQAGHLCYRLLQPSSHSLFLGVTGVVPLIAHMRIRQSFAGGASFLQYKRRLTNSLLFWLF